MERLVLSWVNKPFAFELIPGLNRLGRNPTNDFRVSDASISGFHAEVTLNPDNTAHVRDLASTNGTFIDGIQALDGELRPGQTLRLGSIEFKLEAVMVAEEVYAGEPVLAGGGNVDHTESWARDEEPAKPSFLSKLTQTLRIPFK